jgi:hypothetical protein
VIPKSVFTRVGEATMETESFKMRNKQLLMLLLRQRRSRPVMIGLALHLPLAPMTGPVPAQPTTLPGALLLRALLLLLPKRPSPPRRKAANIDEGVAMTSLRRMTTP